MTGPTWTLGRHLGPSAHTWLRECGVVALLLVVGYATGAAALRSFLATGGQPSFYQAEFSPAVASVCGRGFVRLREDQAPALRAFLQQQTDAFSCDQLPATVGSRPLTPFQAISRYLQLTVAVVWEWRGISWRALDVLSAAAYALVAVLTYGLLRLAFGCVPAALGALAIVISPANLENLPHLRDYAKAPFLLATLFVGGLLVVRPRPRRQALGLCAAGGAVLGVGLGFRNDLLLALPILVVTIAALCPAGGPRPAAARALMLGCLAGTLTLTGLPILKAYARSSNTPHVALLGLMTPFDTALGVDGSVYEYGYVYNDTYAALLVRGLLERDRPVGFLGPGTDDYDGAAAEYLRRIATTFPADLAVRAYAAVLRVFDSPFPGAGHVPVWLPSILSAAVHARTTAMRHADWLVWPGVAAGLGMALAHRRRAGLWLLMIVACHAGSGAVQFHPRHLFYLEPLHIAALFACVSVVWWVLGLWTRLGGRHVGRAALQMLSGPALAVGLVLAAAVGVLWMLREVQTSRVRALLSAYGAAREAPLHATRVAEGAGRVLVATVGTAPGPWPRVMSVLAMRLGGASCDRAEVVVRILYAPDEPYHDYSRELTVPIGPGSDTRVFVPVFGLEEPEADTPPRSPAPVPERSRTAVRFLGLELDQRDVPCLAGLAQIVDDSNLTVPLLAVLPEGWHRQPLYQRLNAGR